MRSVTSSECSGLVRTEGRVHNHNGHGDACIVALSTMGGASASISYKWWAVICHIYIDSLVVSTFSLRSNIAITRT